MTTSSRIKHAARDCPASRVASVSFRLFSGQVRAAGKNPYLPSWNDTPLAVFEKPSRRTNSYSNQEALSAEFCRARASRQINARVTSAGRRNGDGSLGGDGRLYPRGGCRLVLRRGEPTPHGPVGSLKGDRPVGGANSCPVAAALDPRTDADRGGSDFL